MSTRIVAAFDFDKTLTSVDTFAGFLVEVHGRRRVALAACGEFSGLVRGLRNSTDRDAAKERLLVRLFDGFGRAEYERLGDEYGDRIVRSLMREDTRARLNWHKDRGHRVVIVSASLDSYVARAATLLGVDDVIATRMETSGERLTGRLEGPNVRTHEKALRLRALIGADEVDYAYGDSPGDKAMLGMARHPVWVTREPVLAEPA